MGIARWDENDNQGWKRLGVPTIIRHKYKDGPELIWVLLSIQYYKMEVYFVHSFLKFYIIIITIDQIFVSTSLTPSETSY